MKHFSTHELANIKTAINKIKHQTEDTINWVEQNLKYEEKNNVSLQLKNGINIFNKVLQNIDSKPVIAVFGGSQVGKSYLIKNLLSERGQPFMIQDNGRTYDFLKEINPAGGGAESTGVVTRFTIDANTKFDDYPIEVRLLGVKDVLLIVLDSFFLDLKKITSFANTKTLEDVVLHFERNYKSTVQNNFTEFEVLEIKAYFDNHLNKHTILFEGLNETRFFERIGKIIDGFEWRDWCGIFEILWNKNQYLSELFNILVSNLNQIDFQQTVYLSFDEVLRNGGGILDVTRLDELHSTTRKTSIKKPNGGIQTIDQPIISALTAELIFSIPKELVANKPFLTNSDLLDFPGARSRLAIEFGDIKQEVVPKMLLRGKVSYLFNKYSDDFNINNLLFCIRDEKNEVNEIPTLLHNWISRNIGSDVSERSNSLKDAELSPLFLVYTFFNNQLKYDSTNDVGFEGDTTKLSHKWEARFNRFFVNEIVTISNNWHIDWTYQTQNFRNMYLLRDFKYSEDTYFGFETLGFEDHLKPERTSYMNSLKESFLDFEFVKNHFEDPAKSWEASSINNDGSELIIENLSKVSNNASKINHFVQKTNMVIDDIKTLLAHYLKSDDITILRSKGMRNINDIQFSMNALIEKDNNSFNHFIDLCSLDSVEIYNLLNENTIVDVAQNNIDSMTQTNILFETYPELKTTNSIEESIDILKQKLFLGTNDEVLEYLETKNIQISTLYVDKAVKSKAHFYIELVLNFWYSKLNDASNFEYFTNNGLSLNSLTFLAEHWIAIIEKRDFKNKLERILNDVVSETKSNHRVNEFLAETFCLIINEIVVTFDLNYFNNEEIDEINKLHSSLNFRFYNKKYYTDNQTIQGLFETNDLTERSVFLEKFIKWIENFRISFYANCGFINYDKEANEALKNLIESLTNINQSS